MVEVWINWSLEERTQEQRDKLQSCFTEWQNTDLGKTQFVIGLTPAVERVMYSEPDMFFYVNGPDKPRADAHAQAARRFFEQNGYKTTPNFPSCHVAKPNERKPFR